MKLTITHYESHTGFLDGSNKVATGPKEVAVAIEVRGLRIYFLGFMLVIGRKA